MKKEYVFYSIMLNELFILHVRPKKQYENQLLSLFVGGKPFLDSIIFIGRL